MPSKVKLRTEHLKRRLFKMSDENVVDFQGRLAERTKADEFNERMDLRVKMVAVIAEAVKGMRALGATHEQIASILQVVVDDLRSSEPGSFK